MAFTAKNSLFARRSRYVGGLLIALVLLACEGRAPESPSVGAQASTVRGGQRADCIGCHARDYRAVRHPVHEGVRPDRCAACHLQTAWSPAALHHSWPLTGAHANAKCFSCHVGTPPVFEQTPGECVACHRADYDKSPYPGHDKFPLTCADCHTTTAFRPALHAQTERALPESKTKPSHGAGKAHHRAVTPVPAQRATEPTAAIGEAETPAPAPSSHERVHPESQFPIATGPHSGIGCQTCHDQGGAMGKGNTDCVQCHKRSRFDPKHEGVRNYPAGDAPVNFCVACHTRGRVRF